MATTPQTFHGGSSTSTDRTTPSELLVVSWNVQFGVQAAAAAEALLVTPQLQDADVILLQEMDEHGTELVAEALGIEYVYVPASVHPQTGRNFGNAVLSRWPLTDHGVVFLPYTSSIQGQPRQVVHAVADLGEMRIRACSVHTEVPTLSPPKRRRQFAAISDVARAWEGEPLIIGGDFNTLTRRGIDAVSSRLAPIGVRRVTEGAGPTLRRGGREFALDHIYARSLTPVSCGVVAGLDASDHRPLWVRLTRSAHRV
jgi:endonuclease/exonuclease/phosphatase family metal-dependent hydrolase